jgi:hypothetical protein
MSSNNYTAEMDISGLEPELVELLGEKLKAFGTSPEEALLRLRAQLEDVLKYKGSFVLKGAEFTPAEKTLILAWRNKKVEDPEVMALYQQWCKSQEEDVTKKGDTCELRIAFERRRAVLFWNGGLQDEAASAWDDALIIAQQESKDELYQEILAESNDFLSV